MPEFENDTIFVSGLYTYEVNNKYVVCKCSLNVEKFKKMLEDPAVLQHIKENEGYLKYVSMISKRTGKPFSKLEDNNYKEVTSKQHSPDRDDVAVKPSVQVTTNQNEDDGFPF